MAEPPETKPRRSSTAPADRPERPDRKRRFAEAMARAEFGRFYLSPRAEAALREALTKKPRR